MDLLETELNLDELHAVSGGIPIFPLVVLGGVLAGVIYGAVKVNNATDTADQNLDSNCGNNESSSTGTNKLSFGGLKPKTEDPFGGAFTGKID